MAALTTPGPEQTTGLVCPGQAMRHHREPGHAVDRWSGDTHAGGVLKTISSTFSPTGSCCPLSQADRSEAASDRWCSVPSCKGLRDSGSRAASTCWTFHEKHDRLLGGKKSTNQWQSKPQRNPLKKWHCLKPLADRCPGHAGGEHPREEVLQGARISFSLV